MIVVVSTENFGDYKGFPVLNAFQETLILDTVCNLIPALSAFQHTKLSNLK